MKIDSSVDVVANVYLANVAVQSVTPVEQEALDQFGEPVVDVGGSFSGSLTRPGAGSPTAVTYTLPSKLYRLPTNFPVQQAFSLDDSASSDVMAEVYRTTIIARISSAKTTLLAKTAPFVGETGNTL